MAWSETSEQLLDGLQHNLVMTFMSPSGGIIIIISVILERISKQSLGQNCNLSNTLVSHQIAAKLMTFQSASVAFCDTKVLN